ncbi:MAG TPA: hypothetical protein VIW26_01890 [Gemmatimonadales bacterium]|jgi:hypothetical protein
MKLSRRQFLECAAGAAAVVVPLELRMPPHGVVLLDPGAQCSLVESAAGYAAALGARLARADERATPCAALIVPAVVEISAPLARAIAACLHAGGTVILESGAGFAARRACRAHRTTMRDLFQVDVAEPVDVWPAPRGLPYVEYTWPQAIRVRDFSRAVPLASRTGEIIARVNELPMALKRRSGRGTLIVLGSPLGPALWAGDADASGWLRAVLQATPGWG